MNKAVLFDWDGVLVDSTELYYSVYCQVSEHFHRPLRVHSVAEFRQWYDSSWENNYYDMGFTSEDLPRLIEFVHDIIDYTPISLFPGVAEMLVDLSRDFPVAIVSSTPETFIATRLKEAGLYQYIRLISGHGAVSDKSALLATTLQKLNCDKAVMIGDTPADIFAGQSCNIPTIGATYGWYTPDRLRAVGPTLAVDDPLQMCQAIRTVLGSS